MHGKKEQGRLQLLRWRRQTSSWSRLALGHCWCAWLKDESVSLILEGIRWKAANLNSTTQQTLAGGSPDKTAYYGDLKSVQLPISYNLQKGYAEIILNSDLWAVANVLIIWYLKWKINHCLINSQYRRIYIIIYDNFTYQETMTQHAER